MTCWPVDAPFLLEVKSIQPFKRGKNGTIAELPPTEMIGYLLKKSGKQYFMGILYYKFVIILVVTGILEYISKIFTVPKKTNMTKENPPFEDVFLIEKMGMFQPVMLVNSGVYHINWIKVAGSCYASCWAKTTTSQRP